jgi:hypothetical protein
MVKRWTLWNDFDWNQPGNPIPEATGGPYVLASDYDLLENLVKELHDIKAIDCGSWLNKAKAIING